MSEFRERLAAAKQLLRDHDDDRAREAFEELWESQRGSPWSLGLSRRAQVDAVHVIPLHALGLAYVPIPKCAATSVKLVLHELARGAPFRPTEKRPDVHSFWGYRAFTDRGAFSELYTFAVVREPVERLLSAYANRVVQHGDLWRDEAHLGGRSACPGLDDFVTDLEHYWRVSESIFHHTEPQARQLGPDLGWLDDVFPIERLPALVERLSLVAGRPVALPHEQRSTSPVGLDALGRANLEKLIDVYREDYEVLSDFYSVDEVWRRYGR